MDQHPREAEPGGIITWHDDAGQISRVDANLVIVTFQEGSTWIGYCRQLDVSSSGATEKEALEAAREAVKLFFVSCLERGTLAEALTDLGYEVAASLTSRKAKAVLEPMPNAPRVPAYLLKQMEAGNRHKFHYRATG